MPSATLHADFRLSEAHHPPRLLTLCSSSPSKSPSGISCLPFWGQQQCGNDFAVTQLCEEVLQLEHTSPHGHTHGISYLPSMARSTAGGSLPLVFYEFGNTSSQRHSIKSRRQLLLQHIAFSMQIITDTLEDPPSSPRGAAFRCLIIRMLSKSFIS